MSATTSSSWSTDSLPVDALLKIAEQIGHNLRGGEVIELVSDLGGGKTTFTSGLAKGMGSKDQVSSPTFTISKLYKAGKLTLYHFDFYRLPTADLITHELADTLEDKNGVVVVEWADIVQRVLPEDRLTIGFEVTGEDSRRLNISYPESMSYLLEGVK